jgi:hypothetical protein
MKRTLILTVFMFAGAPLLAAPAAKCVLDRGLVLAPYAHEKDASVTEWAASRAALQQFNECPAAEIDVRSRHTFFEAVASEFRADHSAEIRRWRTLYPQSEDGLDVAVGIVEAEMRETMEKLVDRHDTFSRDVILRYGSAKAIAALGPSVRSNVFEMLGSTVYTYGVDQRYSTRDEAIQVLGYWIDATNHEFSPAEKDEFTRALTSLVPHMTADAHPREYRFYLAAVKALRHSENVDAEVALAGWMQKQSDRGSLLYTESSAALEAIRRNRGLSKR